MSSTKIVQLVAAPGEDVESHPFRHDWNGAVHDEILTRKRTGAPVLVRRTESCTACKTRRRYRLNVTTWKMVSRPAYLYAPGEVVRRMDKPTYLRNLFFRTTDLPSDVLEMMM
jgi:hypothetical protein